MMYTWKTFKNLLVKAAMEPSTASFRKSHILDCNNLGQSNNTTAAAVRQTHFLPSQFRKTCHIVFLILGLSQYILKYTQAKDTGNEYTLVPLQDVLYNDISIWIL